MNDPRRKEKNTFLSPKVWWLYAALFGVSIPWYWPQSEPTIWFGLPAWVIVTLLSSFVISGFTAWLLMSRWPSAPSDEKDADG